MKKTIVIYFLLISSIAFAQSNNDKARAYFNQAKSAYSSSNYTQTIEYLNSAEQLLGSTNPVILNLKVKAYYNLEQYDDAKKSLAQFSKVSAKADSGLVDETVAYIVKIDNAIAEEKANKEQARLAEIERKEAERLTEAKKNEELKLSEKLTTLNDKNLNDIDFLYQIDKSSKEVNTELIDPFEIERILRMFGYKLMDSKKHEKALIVFEYTTRLNPDSFQPWVGMAKCYFKIGDYEKSEEYFKKTYSIKPDGLTGEYVKKQLALIPEMRYEDYVKNALANNKYLDENNNITSKENAVIIAATLKHPSMEGYVIHEYDKETESLLTETHYKIIPSPFKESIKHGWTKTVILSKVSTATFYYEDVVKQYMHFKFGADNEISFTFYNYKNELVFTSAYSNVYEFSENSIGGYKSLTIADANMKGKRKIEYNKLSFDYKGNVTYLKVTDGKGSILKQYNFNK